MTAVPPPAVSETPPGCTHAEVADDHGRLAAVRRNREQHAFAVGTLRVMIHHPRNAPRDVLGWRTPPASLPMSAT
jgi:hypothetical protein